MKKFFSKEIIIAVTVLISLAILFVGIDYLKGINVFKPANFYYVKYNNVTGLDVSSPVTINGFKVGLVREINYDYSDNGHMIVELSLDKDLKVPQGTKALLVVDLLGTASIDLALKENSKFYAVGDTLPSENAKGLMDDVNNTIMPAVVQVLPKVDSILLNLNAILANPALNSSITRLDNITANIEKTTANLDAMMAKSVPGVVTNVHEMSQNLNAISKDLAAVTAELNKLPLDSTMNNVHETTENLKLLTTKLNGDESTLGLLLNDRGLYDNLDGTVSSLDSLLIDLKKNPKKYVNFKLF